MNPRQRRGVVLILLAVAGGVGVFFLISSYVSDVQRQLGPMTTVLRLAETAPAHQPIEPDSVEEMEVPEQWAPSTAVSDPLDLAGLVASAELPAGSILQRGMLVPAPDIVSGQREIAILVDAETGVAGKIRPGDVVDIFATFEGNEQAGPAARIVVEQARIVDVGAPESAAPDDSGFAAGEVVPVTFALSIEDSLRLAFVESFATKVRLGLRAPDDTDPVSPPDRVFPGGGAGP